MAWTQPHRTTPPRTRYSLRGLATTLTVLFTIFVALEAIGTGIYVWTGGMYNRLADGDFVSEGEGKVADAATIAHGGLLVLMYVTTAVIFIIWQFRHAVNARTLCAHGGVAHPGWAIGGWFIPIANLIAGQADLPVEPCAGHRAVERYDGHNHLVGHRVVAESRSGSRRVAALGGWG